MRELVLEKIIMTEYVILACLLSMVSLHRLHDTVKSFSP